MNLWSLFTTAAVYSVVPLSFLVLATVIVAAVSVAHRSYNARQLRSGRRVILAIIRSGAATPYFQPIVRLSDGVVTHYEGLIRFEPGVSPEQRFREASAVGLGADLELLALQKIIDEAGNLPSDAGVSVNASPSTILDARFGAIIGRLDRVVTVEITEHEPIDDYVALTEALRALPNVQLGVDDAGSGYATLRHILQLRPAVVKLDMSWVQGVAHDRARQALIRAMASFAAEVGATLTAEGIEDESDARTLFELGVTNGQGFLFGRPVPVHA